MYLTMKYIPTSSNDIIRLIILVIVGTLVYSLMTGWYILKIQKLSLSNIVKNSKKRQFLWKNL
ncbi:hypothetical protein D3C86_2105740 [compost metagenome]